MDGGLSPKVALHLLYQLPEESRFCGLERGGPEFIGWTVDRYLRAAKVDLLNNLLFAYVSANSKRKPKAPESVPRPDDKKKADRKDLFAMTVQHQLQLLKEE